VERFHGGISEGLALVATFSQLEYPRLWPEHVHVTGPMLFELPYPDVELPRGEAPLVLVAPSTAQDPEARLVRTSLEALAREPVRVVATLNRMRPARRIDVPANAVLVDWLSYSQVMPQADVVICHGGHGTVARALAEGVPVLISPALGDMAENGARVAWADAGLMLPGRWLRPEPLRWAVRRILGDPRFTERAAAIAAWSRSNDGAARGAELVEQLATSAAQAAGPN
jgi:UDP:flavonoid glycosyltransferase YjiC (YdhE family)